MDRRGVSSYGPMKAILKLSLTTVAYTNKKETIVLNIHFDITSLRFLAHVVLSMYVRDYVGIL